MLNTTSLDFFTARQRSCWKVMFSHLFVCPKWGYDVTSCLVPCSLRGRGLPPEGARIQEGVCLLIYPNLIRHSQLFGDGVRLILVFTALSHGPMFMQFSRKFGQIIGCCPLLPLGSHPLPVVV